MRAKHPVHLYQPSRMLEACLTITGSWAYQPNLQGFYGVLPAGTIRELALDEDRSGEDLRPALEDRLA